MLGDTGTLEAIREHCFAEPREIMEPLAKITHGKLQQSIRSHYTLRIESWKGVKEE